MTRMPLLVEDDFEYSKVPTQSNFFGNSPINHVLTAVAQEVARLLQHANPVQADDSNHANAVSLRFGVGQIVIQVLDHLHDVAIGGDCS